MANWYGTARSNYFRVKDTNAFKAWIHAMPDLFLLEKDGKFGFYAEGDSGGFPSFINKHLAEVKGTIRSPQGETVHTFTHVAYGYAPDDEDVLADATRHFQGLPAWKEQENPTLDLEIKEKSEEEIEVDWTSMLAPHLAEGEVAILKEAGAEKVRYITGWAMAIAWDGRTTYIGLNDIYAKAAAEFGVESTSINEATY